MWEFTSSCEHSKKNTSLKTKLPLHRFCIGGDRLMPPPLHQPSQLLCCPAPHCAAIFAHCCCRHPLQSRCHGPLWLPLPTILRCLQCTTSASAAINCHQLCHPLCHRCPGAHCDCFAVLLPVALPSLPIAPWMALRASYSQRAALRVWYSQHVLRASYSQHHLLRVQCSQPKGMLARWLSGHACAREALREYHTLSRWCWEYDNLSVGWESIILSAPPAVSWAVSTILRMCVWWTRYVSTIVIVRCWIVYMLPLRHNREYLVKYQNILFANPTDGLKYGER